MKKIFIGLIIFLIYSINRDICFANVIIQIPDTVITKDIITLPINGSIEVNKKTGDILECCFELNGATTDIISIVGTDECAIIDKNISFSFDKENNKLIFSTTEFKSNFNGILFYLTLNIYPRIDFYYKHASFVEIIPTEVSINKNKINLTAKKGTINIKNINVKQDYSERFSYAFPNPFSYETELYFSIESESTFKLEIYNYYGELIQVIPLENNIFNFTIMDASRKIINLTENYKFQRGLYKIILQPQVILAQTGAYRLVFDINNNRHIVNVSFIK